MTLAKARVRTPRRRGRLGRGRSVHGGARAPTLSALKPASRCSPSSVSHSHASAASRADDDATALAPALAIHSRRPPERAQARGDALISPVAAAPWRTSCATRRRNQPAAAGSHAAARGRRATAARAHQPGRSRPRLVACLSGVSSAPVRAEPVPPVMPALRPAPQPNPDRAQGRAQQSPLDLAGRLRRPLTDPPRHRRHAEQVHTDGSINNQPAGGRPAMSGFDINQLTISGNLTRDPELRTPTGTQPVCSIRIAHNERFKDAAGDWTDRAAVLRRHDLGRPGRVDRQERLQGREGRRRRPPALARVGRPRATSARPSTSPPTASSPSSAATARRPRPRRTTEAATRRPGGQGPQAKAAA